MYHRRELQTDSLGMAHIVCRKLEIWPLNPLNAGIYAVICCVNLPEWMGDGAGRRPQLSQERQLAGSASISGMGDGSGPAICGIQIVQWPDLI